MIVSNMELFLMQEERCFYCEQIMSHTRVHVTPKKKTKKLNMGWTVDHFKPIDNENGLDYYQQEDVIVWPKNAHAVKSFPTILT